MPPRKYSIASMITSPVLRLITVFSFLLSAAKLVKMMEEASSKQPEEEKISHDVDLTRSLELLVQKAIGRTIKINEKGNKSSITIGYSDNEDLEKLLKILCGESFFDNI